MRRAPRAPTALADLLGGTSLVAEFRRIVREVLPEDADAILQARQRGADRESARVWAFMEHISQRFPCYELDEYEQVVCGIPFVRNAWGYERFHDVDLRPGELLVFALCAQPYELDARIAVLDACEQYVGREMLRRIPEEGLPPDVLHERLDGTVFAPAADYGDWLWGQTGSVFLDVDDEMEVGDADWTRENVEEAARQWQTAEALLERVDAFSAWLEADLPGRFERLLTTARGEDPRAQYARDRRLYACELTDAGLVPVPHDPDPGSRGEPVCLRAAA